MATGEHKLPFPIFLSHAATMSVPHLTSPGSDAWSPHSGNAKADRLTLFLYIIHPQVVAKAPVICVIVLYLHVQRASEPFKSHFRVQCFFPSAHLLQVNNAHNTKLINKYGIFV
jgi:hypothetical protein